MKERDPVCKHFSQLRPSLKGTAIDSLIKISIEIARAPDTRCKSRISNQFHCLNDTFGYVCDVRACVRECMRVCVCALRSLFVSKMKRFQ